MKVNSIFTSIMGECNPWGQGVFTTFIRFQGCSLLCDFCDTSYAQDPSGGEELEVEQLFQKIMFQSRSKKILLTGGEPLEQNISELDDLCNELLIREFEICIETNGFHPVQKNLSDDLIYIMDCKVSMFSDQVANSIFSLRKKDFCKFLISSREDFVQAFKIIREQFCGWSGPHIYFSAVHPLVTDEQLFFWLKDSYDTKLMDREIKLNVQLHKLIFADQRKEENATIDI